MNWPLEVKGQAIIKITFLSGNIHLALIKGVSIMRPFLYFCIMSNNNKKNITNKSPRKTINIAFPPSKYGLYIALVIIIVCISLIFLG